MNLLSSSLDKVRPSRATRSRVVMYMKMILPAVAVGLIMLLVIWPMMSRDDRGFRLVPIDLKDAVGKADLQMLSPHFVGLDDSNRPFNIVADSAQQSPDQPEIYFFNQLTADYTSESGTWLAITAPRARYDRRSSRVNLLEGVEMLSDDGQSLRTKEVVMDLKSNDVRGVYPVTGHGPLGAVEADGFLIQQGKKKVYLTGDVRLTYIPKQ